MRTEIHASLNNVSGPGNRLRDLVELLRYRALYQSDQLAYTFLANGEADLVEEATLAYKDLDRQVRAIGALLQSMAAPGDRAMLLYPAGLDFMSGFFGCLYAEVIAIPAYPPDSVRSDRRLSRLRSVIKDSQATLALTTTTILSRIKPLFADAPDICNIRWITTDNIDDGIGDSWREPNALTDALAFIQYTSGSTETPRGVMLTHRNLLHNASLVFNAVEHTPSDRYVSWLPTFHDMGFMAGVLQPLYAGIPAILMSPASFLQRPLRWLQAVSQYRATTSGGPNFSYDLCVRKIAAEQRSVLDLSSWSVAFNGAEPIRPETMERFVAAFEPCGFRREVFYPCYGLAEATLIVSGGLKASAPNVKTVDARALEKGSVTEASADTAISRSLVGCGRTLSNQKITIADPQSLIGRPDDQVGEIWVSGDSIAQGYWGRAEQTERAFKARLADTGEGPFLRTGDLGFIHNGELFVTGRLKDLIIIRGLNYYPQDIELTVERSHSAFRPGCGAAFSIDINGEERLVIVQEVERHQPDLTSLIETVRKAVAEEHNLNLYSVVLIKQGGILKTTSGKIRRQACRSAFLEGDLATMKQWTEDLALDSKKPLTPLSASSQNKAAIGNWLASHLALKLRIESGKLDNNQPITLCGLDSLMAIELTYDIQEEFGIDVPIAGLFGNTSITVLADLILAELARTSTSPGPVLAPKRRDSQNLPLSEGQKALWFLHELAPGSPAYIIATAVRIRGELDVSALRSAFQSLTDRHPALRTTFAALQGEPTQYIHEYQQVAFYERDATTWSESYLARSLAEEARRPFNLIEGPLFRITLYKSSAHEHVLLLALHHIISDLWSLAILVQDLAIAYQAESRGRKMNLPPLELQYIDYVSWQQEMLAGRRGEELWSYWRKQLAGELPVLNLPVDKPRTPVQSFLGTSHNFKINAELTQSLKALANTHGVTLYNIILAAFFALLYRYTGQEDILVGSPTAGRNRSELAKLMGYFVNPVALRAYIQGRMQFMQLLAESRQTLLDSLEHSDYPFSLLVERLQPIRDVSRSPLFQVMFVLQKMRLCDDQDLGPFSLGEPSARVNLGEITLEGMRLKQQASQFDLTFIMAEIGPELTAAFQYNLDLFDDTTIIRMAAHFRNLVEGIASDPSRRVSELPLLAQEEAHQLLVEWNDTRVENQNTCIHRLFEAMVERNPDAIALVFRNRRISYRELNNRANQLASYLQKLGVGPEARVGVCLERSIELVVALLGVLKAGGAYVPIDSAYPRERLAFILEDSQVSVVLSQSHLAGNLGDGMERVINLETQWRLVEGENVNNPVNLVTAENIGYLIYTSGSTGRPKGVAIEHASAVAMIEWSCSIFTPESLDGVLAATSICFDLSIFELFVPLSCGGKAILIEDILHLSTLPAASEVALINTVPSAIAELLRNDCVPKSVRKINLAGEPLQRAVVQQAYGLKNIDQIYNLYGPSEDTTYSTFALMARDEDNPPSIGRPITNTRIYILDSDMQPVPPGVVGELCISGNGLARGYVGQPEATAEKFLPDEFSFKAGARLYRTGDLARYLPNGDIEFIGRIDHQVKIRGFRIELGEVESALRQHPSIREAVVIAREDNPGEKRLVAYIAQKQDRVLTEDDLRDHLKKHLPGYMIPSAFAMLKALPLTPNGKVNRQALPAPGTDSAEQRSVFMSPQSPTEIALAEIWAQILNVRQMSIHDNFFLMGGHSLLASRLLARVRSTFQVEIQLRSFFEEPTLRALAVSIERAKDRSAEIQSSGIAPILRNPQRVQVSTRGVLTLLESPGKRILPE